MAGVLSANLPRLEQRHRGITVFEVKKAISVRCAILGSTHGEKMNQSEAVRIPSLLAARQPRPVVEEAIIEGIRMLVIRGDEVDTVIRYNRRGGVDMPQLSSYAEVAESAAHADERLAKQRASGRANTTGEGVDWPRNWKLAAAKAAGKIWYEGRDGTREIWNSNDAGLWQKALNRYWMFVEPSNLALEKEMDRLDAETVRVMNPQEWYRFLLEHYFPWKYTAPNRYTSTTNLLRSYEANNELSLLHAIKEQLFALDKDNIQECLALASSIRGLGIAGASGLLAVLFPAHFGTVDQFAVKALARIPDLPEKDLIVAIKPESLKLSEAAILIRIVRRKAAELNRALSTTEWTPRKVDMALWTCANYISLGEKQDRALGEIAIALTEGAVVNLVGPRGTGKTTILRHLLERLNDATVVAIGLGTLERGTLISRLRQELSSWQGRDGRLVLLLDDWDCAANIVDDQEIADFQRLLYVVVSRGSGSGVVFASQRPLAELQTGWSREILARSDVGGTITVTLGSPANLDRELLERRMRAMSIWERFLRELSARESWLGDECLALGFDIEQGRGQFGAFLVRANLSPEEFVGDLLRPSDIRSLFPDLNHFREKSEAVREAFKQWKAQEGRL